MLQKNPLQPPRPFASCESAPGSLARRTSSPFVSADDFDRTGILTGVDPCESRYWWMPELYGPEAAGPDANGPFRHASDLAGDAQATSRVATRSAAVS
jgi:hypothetical protein